MRVVFKEPGKPARSMVIDGSLKTFQDLVGGYIEHVTYAPGVGVLMNEEGKLLGLKPTCFRYHGDRLVGNLIFVGEEGDEFTDIPDEWRDILVNSIPLD